MVEAKKDVEKAKVVFELKKLAKTQYDIKKKAGLCIELILLACIRSSLQLMSSRCKLHPSCLCYCCPYQDVILLCSSDSE
jgi:hypothetical protein